VPATIVFGCDGSTARLQIFPDPRPGSTPISENPPCAAETGPLRTPKPVTIETANSAAPSDFRRRAECLAGGQEWVVW
jgi:hypothetical protein